MTHLDDWQILTNRYGVAKWVDSPPWARRHALLGGPAPEPQVRCVCPGTTISEPAVLCQQRCTQEDLLCDECRLWCVAIDHAGNYHQLAALR